MSEILYLKIITLLCDRVKIKYTTILVLSRWTDKRPRDPMVEGDHRDKVLRPDAGNRPSGVHSGCNVDTLQTFHAVKISERIFGDVPRKNIYY